MFMQTSMSPTGTVLLTNKRQLGSTFQLGTGSAATSTVAAKIAALIGGNISILSQFIQRGSRHGPTARFAC
jgi:hypothetical protein